MSAPVSPPTQHVRQSHCPHCRLVVLTTDAEESQPSVLTHTRMVDPTPISQLEEVACIITGRSTWAWQQLWGTQLLDLRTSALWRATHAQETPETRPVVLPEHLCGARFRSTLPQATTARLTPSQRPVDQSHQPDLLDALADEKEIESCPF